MTTETLPGSKPVDTGAVEASVDQIQAEISSGAQQQAAESQEPAPAAAAEPAEQPRATINDSRNAIFEKARQNREQYNSEHPDKIEATERMMGREPSGKANSEEGLALNRGTRKLKVDGQEVEVSEDKILEAGVRTLQKEVSADRRLAAASAAEQLAAQRLAEADERLRQAHGTLPSGGSHDSSAGGLPNTGDSPDAKAIAKAAMAQVRDALFEGNSEDAESALLDATRKMTQSSTRAQVVAETNDSFVKDFPDIANNPAAFAKAIQLMKAELGKNPAVASIPVLASRIGFAIRAEVLRDVVAKPKAPAEPVEDRTTLKARLPAMPSQASTRAPDSRPAETPRLTPKEVIQQMRKARGQVVA